MTIKDVTFKARARTVDHLGREQIADCPTAVSELWKNSYDAYARKVELNIFDGDMPVAVIADDGHGMSYVDLTEKWLVIGTDSKFSGNSDNENDRDGLAKRERQGQKGIGRLSCANLGAILLLISKKKDLSFAAALIDWRLFENPFVLLQDLRIPTVEFDNHLELSSRLHEMTEVLHGNLRGSGKPVDLERDKRITAAWDSLSALESAEKRASTREAILNSDISNIFKERHLSVCDIWTGRSPKGTAMLISHLSDDLIAQLSEDSRDLQDEATRRSQERLFQTLSNFIDPFQEPNHENRQLDFTTAVTAWNGQLRRPLIDEERTFHLENLYGLEHIVEGRVDEQGTFLGRIKVFGKWHEDVAIEHHGFKKGRGSGTCGAFHIRLGGYEKDFKKTSLDRETYDYFQEKSLLYSGFMVHRDALRVMPYGREDNDYFEIEKRRSIHAGRYFWSHRSLFGRVAITRENNPNLKDKAGREGLIDNTASKRFRSIVENILIETAKKFFGSDSENRKNLLPDIKAQRAQERADVDKKKLTSKNKKIFRSKLRTNFDPLLQFENEIEAIRDQIASPDELDIAVVSTLKTRISELQDRAKEFSLSPVPSSLGTMEEDYRAYRQVERRCITSLSDINSSINTQLNKLSPKTGSELLKSHIQKAAGRLHGRIRSLSAQGRELIEEESERFNNLVVERNKSYHQIASAVIESFDNLEIDFGSAIQKLDELYQSEYEINENTLQPYISALEKLKDQIDLDNLAQHAIYETHRLRTELERIHSLAQLGITVEIVGHELEALDMTMSRGLRELPDEIKKTHAYASILDAQQSLSDRWRFLSPLKLSGEKVFSTISGAQILAYVSQFFAKPFSRNAIDFSATQAFLDFNVHDQPARIYPVFINLVNNSLYWLLAKELETRKILLDFVDGDLVIADTGPGVAEDDIPQLFSLFFTRKTRGGRGVGLYLCRTNLLASGHTIFYETEEQKKVLSGANFKIRIKGASNE
jgi:signal transduction histidine kinase